MFNFFSLQTLKQWSNMDSQWTIAGQNLFLPLPDLFMIDHSQLIGETDSKIHMLSEG
jgi:hypothetical protein